MDRHPAPDLARSLVLVAFVDLVLAAGSLIGAVPALLVATAIVWVARTGSGSARLGHPGVAAPLGLGLGVGYLSYAAWLAAIFACGSGLGLPAPTTPSARAAPLAAVAMAPLFEEVLYRERLMLALAPRVGGVAAVAGSSAAFAVAHVAPWQVLGTFWVGLALGAVAIFGHSLWLCIGIHAGLNAAGWLHAAAPPLSPAVSALAGSGALAAGWAFERWHRC